MCIRDRFPSSSVFTESLEPLQAIYHDNLSAGLRFDDDSFLPIQTGQRAVQSGFPEALSFRMTEYSWSDSRFVYISIPLENFNLCFQASIYLQPLFQKQLIIAAGLLDIFLIDGYKRQLPFPPDAEAWIRNSLPLPPSSRGPRRGNQAI